MYYQHLALEGEVLAVGTSTDVWLLTLPRHEEPLMVAEDSLNATQVGGQAGSLVGQWTGRQTMRVVGLCL